LDVKKGKVVKGVKFVNLKIEGDPVKLASYYEEEGADELVFLDITASYDRRGTMLDVVKKTADMISIPFTVGGGIRNIRDVRSVLSSGADKVSINTSAVRNPQLVKLAAETFGSQCIVVAIDAKRRYVDPSEGVEDRIVLETPEGPCWFECSYYGGRRFTGLDAVKWALEVEERGAGEILLTSMDRDGTKDGYDIALTRAISDKVNIPIIASGGVGNLHHLYEGLVDGGASAVLAASIFHFREYTVQEAKEYLRERGVPVRL